MDPITIGFFFIVAAFVIGFMLFMFRSFGKETNFEEAYGQNALRLLSEDKAFKPKSSKASRKTKTASDKKKETTAEKEHLKQEKTAEKKTEENVAEAHEIPVPTEQAKPLEPEVSTDVKQGKKKGKAKHIAEEAAKSAEVPESKVEQEEPKVEKVVENVVENVPVEEAEPFVTKVSDKKAKKKKTKKIEEVEAQPHFDAAEEKVMKAEARMPEAVHEKPKQTRPIFITKEINEDSFISRLSDFDGIEPEYLSYIVKHFDETSTQFKKFSDESGMLRKQCSDREKLIAQCTDKLAVLSKKEQEWERIRRQFEEDKKKHEEAKANFATFEKTVSGQLTQSLQDKRQMQQLLEKQTTEISNLKQELSKAKVVVQSAPSPDVLKQADLLRNEVNLYKSTVQQLETKLKQKDDDIENLTKDVQESQRNLDMLKQSSASAEKRAKEIEAQAEAIHRTFEEKLQRADNTAAELQLILKEKAGTVEKVASQEKERASELEQQLQTLKNKMKVNENEYSLVLRENMDYKTKYACLEDDHKTTLDRVRNEMAELMQQNEENKSMISLKLSEASVKMASMKEANAKLETLTLTLKHQLSTVRENERKLTSRLQAEAKKAQDALEELEEAKNGEIKRLEKELETSKQAETEISLRIPGQEVQTLVKMDELQSAKPSKAEEEVRDLKSRLLEQEKKNEELRASNYKIVEITQKQEQLLSKKLKEAENNYEKGVSSCITETAKLLSKALPAGHKLPPLPKSSETGVLLKWLTEAGGLLQTNLAAGAVSSVSKKETPQPTKDGESENIKELKNQVERYRNALASVSASIEVIEREAAAKSKHYEKEIAQLKREVVDNTSVAA